jgi:oligopeptide transport system substrate-binding protein
VPSTTRFLAGLFALSLIAGCTKRETPVELGNRTQVLHQNIGAEPQDLDPPMMQTNSHYQVLMALYEGLTGYDPQDLHPIPGVAERWDISADGLVYTFHLRANARWSNGDPVTAQDFVFSARRTLTPALGSPYPFYYFVVRGAEDFAASRTQDFTAVGIRALDDRTLRIELNQPAPYLLFLLGSFAWMPVHRATVEKHGRFDQPYTGWTKPGEIVTNGPFALADWQPGQEIIVKKNPRYWDAANVRLNEIHFHLMENLDTEERAFRSGQLHLTEYVPGPKLKAYHDKEPALLQAAPFFMTYYYDFDTTRPPFNDVRVRQAFSLALDRDRLIASEPSRGLRAAISYVPPGVDGYAYQGPDRLHFDPAEARRLLAAAGYPEGRGFPAVDISFSTNGRHQQIAEVMQQMWRQNLGLHLNLMNTEGRVFNEERLHHAYQLSRSGWIGDYLDAHAFLSVYVAGGGQNVSGWTDATYDRLVRESLDERDKTKRFALYRQIESMLLRELPVLPLFHDSSPHLVNPAVRGWYPNLLNYHPYQRMWLESK